VPLLSVEGLETHFATSLGILRAVDGVSFAIDKGEVLGLVGESGCGKSVTSLSIMRLVPPPGRVAAGRVLFEGEDLLAKDPEAMRRVRGARIAMVFQEPMTSLNPVFSIGDQIASAVLAHGGGGNREAWERTEAMLDLVQIPSPRQRARDYPHQLSGGLRQRAMIAMALACRPVLVISDEPTSALDVTVQAQILDLLLRLQREYGMALLIITHDPGVVAYVADLVTVLYCGKVMETGPVATLFDDPQHPYLQALLRSTPRFGVTEGERLQTIPGTVPDPLMPIKGCPFLSRCPEGEQDLCGAAMPARRWLGPGHQVACYKRGSMAESAPEPARA